MGPWRPNGTDDGSDPGFDEIDSLGDGAPQSAATNRRPSTRAPAAQTPHRLSAHGGAPGRPRGDDDASGTTLRDLFRAARKMRPRDIALALWLGIGGPWLFGVFREHESTLTALALTVFVLAVVPFLPRLIAAKARTPDSKTKRRKRNGDWLDGLFGWAAPPPEPKTKRRKQNGDWLDGLFGWAARRRPSPRPSAESRTATGSTGCSVGPRRRPSPRPSAASRTTTGSTDRSVGPRRRPSPRPSAESRTTTGSTGAFGWAAPPPEPKTERRKQDDDWLDGLFGWAAPPPEPKTRRRKQDDDRIDGGIGRPRWRGAVGDAA